MMLHGVRGMYKCFPTVESLAHELPKAAAIDLNDLTKVGATIDSRNCTLLAKAIVSNRYPSGYHFYYDTKFVVAKVPVKSPLLVIRNEFLWHDWQSANQYLGQETVSIFPALNVRDFSNQTRAVTKDLSNEGRKNLCQALEAEYEAYRKLIQRAVNLSPEEKAASFQLAERSCPDNWKIAPAMVSRSPAAEELQVATGR